MRTIMACFKFAAFGLLCAVIVPTQSLILAFTQGPAAYPLPRLWHAGCCRIFGINFTVQGTPEQSKQTLYMSNHLSYLDIPLIGSILKCAFVAKSEVEGWALFGFLATLQQTAFIQRKKSAAAREKAALQDRIDAGESLIIFPEGTSTSGYEVLPFKSSLFALALPKDRKSDLYIQPITLQLLEVDGKRPSSKAEQDVYAWPRDVETPLFAHLWRFAKTSGAKLQITFHKALRTAEYTDRKVLAKTCHDTVSKGLTAKAA